MISAVVLTKNEQENIHICLNSLSFCDEIIVVDDFSTDGTLKTAKKFTTKIFKRKLDNDFSKQRNFGLEKASFDWVIFVDADEMVSKNLKKEMIKKVKNSSFNGYYIKREDIFLGKKMRYGETGNIQLIRLAKKNSGFWVRPVHEVWKVNGKLGICENVLLHNSHQTIKEFLNKINFYSTLNANYLFSTNTKASMRDMILYPGTKFFLNFILKKGFLDGIYGFMHAFFMSLHSFLTRSKLYLMKYDSKS